MDYFSLGLWNISWSKKINRSLTTDSTFHHSMCLLQRHFGNVQKHTEREYQLQLVSVVSWVEKCTPQAAREKEAGWGITELHCTIKTPRRPKINWNIEKLLTLIVTWWRSIKSSMTTRYFFFCTEDLGFSRDRTNIQFYNVAFKSF